MQFLLLLQLLSQRQQNQALVQKNEMAAESEERVGAFFGHSISCAVLTYYTMRVGWVWLGQLDQDF